MSDLRAMMHEAFLEIIAREREVLTEWIKENPDVYRRGPTEFMKPKMTPTSTMPMRKELRMMDEDTFLSTLDRLVEATSVEETADMLGGGRE